MLAGSPNAMGLLEPMAGSGTPMLAPVGTAAAVLGCAAIALAACDDLAQRVEPAGEVAADRESPEEDLARGSAKARKIRLFENGIDYDGYLEGFRRGKTETDRLRSLVDLSRSLRAVNAGIFVATGGRFEAKLKVGLLDHAGTLAFSAQEPVGARYLHPRKAVVVAGSLEKVTALARHFHPDDLKYMQGALFLPAVYQGANAVLFLGLPVKKRWSMAEIITSLNIY